MSKRTQVEQCAVLDIKQLPRIQCSYTDEELRMAKLYPEEKVTPTGPRIADLPLIWSNGERQRVTVKVVLTTLRCGGTRQWFECPGCQRRVGKLFSPKPGHEFKCHRCYRLVYRSQYNSGRYYWSLFRKRLGQFCRDESPKLFEINKAES